MRLAVVLSLVVLSQCLVACQRGDEKQKVVPVESSGSATAPAKPTGVRQLPPPVDLKAPPADALKTSSGLIYKRLGDPVPDGTPIKRNDTVLINYTGWRQETGETFFSNKGESQPLPLPLANAAPGFTEAMQLMKKGEKAVLWIPPEIGYKGTLPAGAKAETLVYEVEIVDVVSAPPVPANLGAAPANAKALPSGTKYLVVKPGTGTEKARFYDTVTFNYSAWDSEGRMFDSTVMRKRPAVVPPFRQSAAMEEILTTLGAGERALFWVASERMTSGGKPIPGMPPGILTYEVEMLTIAKGNEPPKTPPDVAAVPTSASKTEKGVAYRVLAKGKGGPKPGPQDTVRVNYTGWTTDGRMFDSSTVKGEPGEFSLGGVIAGWTDAIPLMSVGDKMRFWIPDELAYKGAPGKPQGMLVYDVELVEIKAAPKAEANPSAQPAPPDVAAPPADAKKSPKGVHYKILKAVPGAPHPTPTDKVSVHYTGWTTDGKQFDSSRKSGKPLTFTFDRVIPGWGEGIPLVGLGEQARLWIPEELAYPNGGGPKGMLVFDVELMAINPP
ncbi:MAG: FKBP-type peptidyl-prolyl cis-trans isomerase [Kofleriaceae bacterium]|nr:FKBP-type peptidyl-prolyl cis-trans isomerase [Kofleriaceae bacterium]